MRGLRFSHSLPARYIEGQRSGTSVSRRCVETTIVPGSGRNASGRNVRTDKAVRVYAPIPSATAS